MIYDVRSGTNEDILNVIPLIKEFCAESISEYGIEITTDQALEAFKRFVKHSLLLTCEGSLVGLLAGDFIEFPITKEKIFQEQIWFVSKDHRRHGLRLVKELEKRLLLMSCHKLIMGYMSNSMSDRLHRLYESMGFKFMEAHFIKSL